MKLTTLLAALMLGIALALSACGDDDDDDGGNGGGQADTPAGPARLTITETGQGLQVEGTPAPGVTEVTLQNDGKKPATAQLIRVTGDETRKEVEKTYAGAGEGDPIPEWFRADGGPGTTAPGDSSSVTLELEEGTYYAVNDEDKPDVSSAIEVSGDAADAELPETDGSVTAEDYSFEASGLQAGDNQLTFENAGEEPHHVLALPIVAGSTFEDAERFLKTEKGKPAVDFEKGAFSTVIDGGKSMVIDVALKKGDYALVCFISDRAGGKSHFDKGMISEATVE
jgi:hypothetical protein